MGRKKWIFLSVRQRSTSMSGLNLVSTVVANRRPDGPVAKAEGPSTTSGRTSGYVQRGYRSLGQDRHALRWCSRHRALVATTPPPPLQHVIQSKCCAKYCCMMHDSPGIAAADVENSRRWSLPSKPQQAVHDAAAPYSKQTYLDVVCVALVDDLVQAEIARVVVRSVESGVGGDSQDLRVVGSRVDGRWSFSEELYRRVILYQSKIETRVPRSRISHPVGCC